MIEQAVAVTFPDSEQAQKKLETKVDPSLPLALADETALTHCLENLLTNAVKFGTTEDVIRLTVSYDRDSSRILLSVADSGKGIDPKDLPHLFEPFHRGDAAAQTPGNGLGLTLVQRMIEGQNGHVSVSSTPGEGATFTLHIPVASEEVGEQIKWKQSRANPIDASS